MDYLIAIALVSAVIIVTAFLLVLLAGLRSRE
jgi:hypothetical protein